MHLTLTELLVCPRCGPPFGLVLLADRVENRRVLEGWLGCANCRERYPVAGGFADLRTGPGPAEAAIAPAADANAALRWAALAGITEGPAFLLLLGASTSIAAGIAELVPRLEVVTLDSGMHAWE